MIFTNASRERPAGAGSIGSAAAALAAFACTVACSSGSGGKASNDAGSRSFTDGGGGGATAQGGVGGVSGSAGTTGGTSGGAQGSGASGGAAGAMGSGGTSSGGSNSGTGGASTGGAAEAGSPGLSNPAPGSKLFAGANFWNIDWEGQDDFFTSGVDFTTTANPWRPELLADLAPYHVLRFMDWNLTNTTNNPQAVWNTRKQKTAAQNEPVAFEWQIDLCNRTHKDYWLNVPHESAPDYWPKLAALVKDQLDPDLRVYLEWSNEVWNGGFPQNAYAATQAQSLSLAGGTPSASYYVYEAVRVFEAFEAVFGKGSPRLVKVLSGQAAYTGPCQAHMTALKDTTINPNGTKPDVYAVAPYFSGTSISALGTAIPTAVQWMKDSRTCAQSGAFPLVTYEGGSDSFSAPNNGCTTLQHDPGMHDLYTTYLDGLSSASTGGPFMQYTHTGACWGLKEKTADSLASSPKYQGLLDWIAAHP